MFFIKTPFLQFIGNSSVIGFAYIGREPKINIDIWR